MKHVIGVNIFLSKQYVLFGIAVGQRPVIVKRALIGSKGGWKLSTIFLSCKVFYDWSIINRDIYCIY